ncbi:TIGR02677 family protein [Intrasporangium calvum]|nr:TIGR02677 family protein [Intrasporangium calvum]
MAVGGGVYSGGVTDQPSADEPGGTQVDRVRLEALRYAVNEESATYIAVMRLFTGGLAGMLSDQSAAEVSARLAEQGIALDEDTVDARLAYLVEHGNLARSPRESEARSLQDYLRNRARYQLTQRGELVQRQVDELLGHTETATEVSSEMLGAILAGLRDLARLPADVRELDPQELAQRIGTIFAQFDRLVHSTREFYTYLTQVLSRFDLERGEFQAFKTALIDYLQRFVDEIARHLPQIAEVIEQLRPGIPQLCARANAGQRLVDLEGRAAKRAPGLDPADWNGLIAWFTGSSDRASDAEGVRRLATEAMRSLLANLRRIVTSHEREHGRHAELLRLARWFDDADDTTAHAIWASAFGLYSSRHLGFPVSESEDAVPPTMSWVRAPRAEVPIMLRSTGQRRSAGASGRPEDFSQTKARRLEEHARADAARRRAVAEVAGHRGRLDRVRLSDAGREALMELYAAGLALAGSDDTGSAGSRTGAAVPIPGHDAVLLITSTPGAGTVVVSPSGRLRLVDRSLAVEAGAGRQVRDEAAGGKEAVS